MRRIKANILLFFGGIAAFVCLNFSSEIMSRVVMYDKIFLNGEVRNLYGKLVGENWEVVKGLNFETLSMLDFSLIAHGNGFRNDTLENSREGFILSKANGITAFEIDIWTNDRGTHCSHEMRVNEPVCDLSVLFGGLEKNDYIVVDIKNEFENTLRDLVENQDPNLLKQTIVQLYHPSDAVVFSKLSSHFHGAIFTLYLANRRLDHICKSLSSSAFPAIVINISKLNSAERACPDHQFIVHPVKRCDVLLGLKANNNVNGAFVSGEALNCKD